jgi:hypothetical protein
MALQKLEFRPGVNRESTNYANEGGYYSSDKVRFRSGYAQKIGGWTNSSDTGDTYDGVARYLWNYVTTDGLNLMFVGTNQKVYVELGGDYNDITPLASTASLTVNPFTTEANTRNIFVTKTAHGLSLGTYVSFSGATTLTVGGSPLVVNGEYEVVSIPGTDTFTIFSPSINVSAVTGGGSAVIATFDINAGNAVYTTGVGWGGPPWGAGGWGSNVPEGVQLRIWSAFNYGNDIIFAERGGEVYYWERDTTNWARAITLSAKANSVVKFSTTATWASGATTITVSDATGINTGAVVTASGIPSGAYVLETWAGGLAVPLSATTTASGTLSAVSFSYAGRHVPREVNLVIDSAINDFTVCMGATPYDPTDFTTDFDPLLVRWADQDNPWEWVPEVTNQSGEQRLSHGSYIVASDNSRQELLVWTDAAIYSMQYIGPPFVWSFNLLDQDISIISQNCLRTVNNVTYWMGRDKFYAYTGRVETLPCTLRTFVFNNINMSQAAQVACGHNEGFSEIWWFYPSANSTVNDSYIIYNYLEQSWYYGTLSRSAWSEQSLRDYPLAAFGIQSSYLDAAINATQTTITLINGSSYPDSGTVLIDSEQISYSGKSIDNPNELPNCVRGVNQTTAASHVINSDVTLRVPNQVLLQEFGLDDDSGPSPQPIEAYIESSDFDIGEGHNFAYVWRILPDLTFAGSTAGTNASTNPNPPNVLLTIKARQNSGSAYNSSSSPYVTATIPIAADQYNGQVYTRIRGRQVAFRVASTALGETWQVGAMRIDIRPDGRR